MDDRGYLLLSATATGAGPVISGYGQRIGMLWWSHTARNASANSGSASAAIYGSPDSGMGWWPITSIAVGGPATGSAQLTAAYGHLMASATWISASGMITMFAQWATK